MAELNALSETDANNTSISGNSVAEQCPPSGINDAIRALAGMAKRFWDRINGTLQTAGTQPAYTLTYSVAPASYVTGETYKFRVHAANAGGAATLNVNALGAKNLYKATSSGIAATAANDLQIGQVISATYDGTQFVIDGLASITYTDATNGGITVSGTTLAQNVADLSAVTPAQTSTLAFESGSGTKKATLAGAANSLVNIAASTKAQMQTGTDNTTVVTPARVNDQDGVAKAYATFSASGGTITNKKLYGVSSITRNGAGDYTVNFSTAFADTNYAYALEAGRGVAAATFLIAAGPYTVDPTTTAFRFVVATTGGTGTDVEWVSATFWGRQ